MISILFVCHGNICRSPMAESVFANLVKEAGVSEHFSISSAAAHSDEIGNPPHRGTQRILSEKGVPLVPHRARLMTDEDGTNYDYLIGMDEYNVRDMRRIVKVEHLDKVSKLLDFTARPRAIADPWYTGDFEYTYRDVSEGCNALLAFLREKYGI